MTSFRDAMGMNQPLNGKYLSAGGISRIWREQTKRGSGQQQKTAAFFSLSLSLILLVSVTTVISTRLIRFVYGE